MSQTQAEEVLEMFAEGEGLEGLKLKVLKIVKSNSIHFRNPQFE